MGTAIRMPLLNTARRNLSNFVLEQADLRSRLLGFGYVDAPVAPETYLELVAAYKASMSSGRPLPVWRGASDKTVYTSQGANWAGRYWHDCLHVQHRLQFTTTDEVAIGWLQLGAVAAEFGADSLEWALMYTDTVGQAYYAAEHGGQFPDDQLAFAIETIDWLK